MAVKAEFGDMSVFPGQHEEGPLTKTIEQYTSMVPSGIYLSLAFATVGLSLGLRLSGRREDANFVAHWTSTILLLGVYNKIVKVHGSQ
ncbi:hypothetical protein BH23PLA1_BH23PLA1_17410 [soil metagenome]